MRVISGENKGRALKAVPGVSTRPTTDKIKESIFNIIGPFFEGGLMLDLFAGSGGLGIEALSRGGEKCIFVDKDGKAIHTLNENIKNCGMEDKSEVYRIEALRAVKALKKRELSFATIFMDPPYKIADQICDLLTIIDKGALLDETGTIVCEHGRETTLPERIGRMQQFRVEEYGTTTVSFYRMIEGEMSFEGDADEENCDLSR